MFLAAGVEWLKKRETGAYSSTETLDSTDREETVTAHGRTHEPYKYSIQSNKPDTSVHTTQFHLYKVQKRAK